ncbi:hypothetical protein MKW94_006058 [Papaver nudicaule]|uniref:SANT domain-containing protein n=1 Tax=Papaver nudicaule TaxID=74823 RepID=A0AA41UZ51_PAPNU|nr:hypothetical protein [Papaver nudicaule]
MDSGEMDDVEHHIEDQPAELLPSPRDIFGDPDVFPRVGEQYQVEIPEKEGELDNFKNTAFHFEAAGTCHSSPMGLSIPVMWVYDQVDDPKLEGVKFQPDPGDRVGAKRSERRARHKNSDHKGTKAKVEPFVKLEKRKNSTMVANQLHMDLPSMDEQCDLIAKGYCPVPGSVSNSWTVVEKDSFLLGLYIFGKNLVQVKKFVESKEMGDIQSYYYGKFFRSDAHRRWSEGRKVKGKRCANGLKIFTGSRQQELLSRLLPHVPKNCENGFIEVGKKYTEGTITLEDYVSHMKATVGIKTLVEAVGIGKCKRDLTGISDSVRFGQAIHVRREIPTGKECNSLTSADILKFLNGDFRLSKARSNELFWDAVWPRLLARGWHSEQPKCQGYNNGNKNSLVFLIPNVKKFSRKRHVKGNHYFDSVTDILNKVVSDPTLLDVVVEEAPRENDNKEAHEWAPEVISDQDVPSDHQRHCYLKPRLPSSNADLVKFIVVDTSLINEERPFKMRDLRTLPVETNNTSAPSSISRETVVVSCKERLDNPDSVAMLVDEPQQDTVTSRPRKDNFTADSLVGVSRQRMTINGSVISNFPEENQEFQYADVNDKQVGKASKCRLKKRGKLGESNSNALVKKRRKLAACAKKERSLSTNNISTHFGLKEAEEPSSNLDSPDANEHMVPEEYSSREKVLTGYSTKEDQDDSNERQVGRKAEQRIMIDLNALPEYEGDDPFIMEERDIHNDGRTKGLSLPAEVIQPEDPRASARTSNGISSAEDQPTINARRQSTRNRPPTAKALEALVGGYLTTKSRKSRDKKSLPRDKSFTRPSPRVRAKGCVVTGSADAVLDEKVEEECSSNTDMLRESQIQSEIKGGDELMLSLSLPPYHSEMFAGRYNQPGYYCRMSG